MTTLADRPNTAVLVVDVQAGVVGAAHDRDAVLGNIATVVGKARAAGVEVVWVQHSDDQLPVGSDDWQLLPEPGPQTGELVVHKNYGDSFEATELEPLLASRGVGALVITGAQTDACVRATMHGAFVRGYDVTLVSDAHTTEDLSEWGAPPPAQVIAHANLYWQWQAAPGRTATVVSSAELHF